MLRRKVMLISACSMLLIVSAVHADDDEYRCQLKLMQAESVFNQKINEKLLSENDIEIIILLLDDADEACTKGDQKGVDEALDKMNKLVSSADSSQRDQ